MLLKNPENRPSIHELLSEKKVKEGIKNLFEILDNSIANKIKEKNVSVLNILSEKEEKNEIMNLSSITVT
jgi:hypothetical protein